MLQSGLELNLNKIFFRALKIDVDSKLDFCKMIITLLFLLIKKMYFWYYTREKIIELFFCDKSNPVFHKIFKKY